MTENEKKLLKINNKKNIKEMNGINAEKEDLEMMSIVLEDALNECTEENMKEYHRDRKRAVLKISQKYNVVLSEVLEFKVQQLWNMFEDEVLNLKKKFLELEKQNFQDRINIEIFQKSAKEFSYLLDELGLTFRSISTKKAEKEKYDGIIPEYTYEDLDANKLFLAHAFYYCQDLNEYIISVKESFELLDYIQKYIVDIVSDKTKEKCTTGANICMIVTVEIEGMYVCKLSNYLN